MCIQLGILSFHHSGLRKFAGAFEKSSTGVQVQADIASLHFGELLNLLGKTCDSAEVEIHLNNQGSFAERTNAISNQENAIKSKIKKQMNVDKLKLNSAAQHTKIDAAMGELNEAKTHEEASKDYLTKISAEIQDTEWPAFTKIFETDLNTCVNAYVKDMMQMESKVVKEWEAVLPDIKAIQSVGVAHHAAEKIAAEVL